MSINKILLIVISIPIFLVLAYHLFIYSITIPAGSLGGGNEYKFDCTRGELHNCISAKSNIPDKWKKYNDWNQVGYDFLNGVIFYFDSSRGKKEEMYYVTLVKQLLEDSINTKPSYLAIRSVFDNENNIHHWKDMDEFSEDEVARIEQRFKSEILDKMKSDTCSCNLIEVQTKK